MRCGCSPKILYFIRIDGSKRNSCVSFWLLCVLLLLFLCRPINYTLCFEFEYICVFFLLWMHAHAVPALILLVQPMVMLFLRFHFDDAWMNLYDIKDEKFSASSLVCSETNQTKVSRERECERWRVGKILSEQKRWTERRNSQWRLRLMRYTKFAWNIKRSINIQQANQTII